MKRFEQRQIREAVAYAVEGGQSLHLMSGSFAYLRSDTPGCFKGRRQIAHLFDQDRNRLIATARRFGVRVIRVERDGTPRQHIDLCGNPLERAQAACDVEVNIRTFPDTTIALLTDPEFIALENEWRRAFNRKHGPHLTLIAASSETPKAK